MVAVIPPDESGAYFPQKATEDERTPEGARSRFYTLTTAAIKQFQEDILNNDRQAWEAAVQLRNKCEDAALKLQEDIRKARQP